MCNTLCEFAIGKLVIRSLDLAELECFRRFGSVIIDNTKNGKEQKNGKELVVFGNKQLAK